MKYRGKQRVTKEMLKAILALPEEVELQGIVHDQEREIFSVLLSSEEEVKGWTFVTGEGQEMRQGDSDLWMDAMKKRHLEMANNIKKEERRDAKVREEREKTDGNE